MQRYGKTYASRDKKISLEKLTRCKPGGKHSHDFLNTHQEDALPYNEKKRRRHNYATYSSKVK